MEYSTIPPLTGQANTVVTPTGGAGSLNHYNISIEVPEHKVEPEKMVPAPGGELNIPC